jgi:hypothetical protein
LPTGRLPGCANFCPGRGNCSEHNSPLLDARALADPRRMLTHQLQTEEERMAHSTRF